MNLFRFFQLFETDMGKFDSTSCFVYHINDFLPYERGHYIVDKDGVDDDDDELRLLINRK